MNVVLEQKLKELIEESVRCGSPATFMVLNQLLASHLNGKHHKFAKHCSQFSAYDQVGIEMNASIDSNDETEDAIRGNYIH